MWFSFREKLGHRGFETGPPVSSFLQLFFFLLSQKFKLVLYLMSLVGFIDIFKITSLIETVGEPKAFNQLSMSPKGCYYGKETENQANVM